MTALEAQVSGRLKENATHHLGLRFSPTERADLQAVTDSMNEQLEAQGLPGSMTATSMIKWMIREEMKRPGPRQEGLTHPHGGRSAGHVRRESARYQEQEGLAPG